MIIMFCFKGFVIWNSEFEWRNSGGKRSREQEKSKEEKSEIDSGGKLEKKAPFK